jgi:hypothetical protein
MHGRKNIKLRKLLRLIVDKLSMKCPVLVFSRFLQTREKISADSSLLTLRMTSAVQCEDVSELCRQNKASRAAICEDGMGTADAIFISLPG